MRAVSREEVVERRASVGKVCPGRAAEGGARTPVERMYRVEVPGRETRFGGGVPKAGFGLDGVGGGGAGCVGAIGADEARCWAAFRAAVMKATEIHLVSRRAIAGKLGVSVRTLDHWMSPGEPERMPRMGVLLRLMTRRDILPETVRLELVAVIVDSAAMVAVALCAVDVDQAPLLTQALEVSAAHGRVAERLRRATEAGGEGGCEITKSEAEGLLRVLEPHLRETAEMVETARRLANGT